MGVSNRDEGFAGKVAFVTGAASGIGRATALAFARAGASVVAADVSDEGNGETLRMVEDLGGRGLAVRCDVGSSGDVKASMEQAVREFGGLDFAFNDAGVEQPITPIAELMDYAQANLRINAICSRIIETEMMAT